MSVDYERITELDIHDPERDEPYVECSSCGDSVEYADMASGNAWDGYLCHGCLRDEQHERYFTARRHG